MHGLLDSETISDPIYPWRHEMPMNLSLAARIILDN